MAISWQAISKNPATMDTSIEFVTGKENTRTNTRDISRDAAIPTKKKIVIFL